MFTPYPLLFRPILKPRVWGGRRLARLGKTLPADGTPIGESWELADLPADVEAGQSVISNGSLAGQSLHEAIASHRDAILGGASLSAEGGFPLLLKYLDARENLSVQVHPTPAYAAAHPGAHVKSEAWVVIEAEPGSFIYRGLRPGLTDAELRRHIATGEIVGDLVKVPARAGECRYLQSGTCHALGAGVLVAEVQTPSDTTFRLYDWGRSGRTLHIEEALQCIDFKLNEARPDSRAPADPIKTREFTTEDLCRTEHFAIERITAVPGADLPVVTQGRPVVWMILSGDGSVRTAGAETVGFSAGTTMLMPAAIRQAAARFHRETVMLRVLLPSKTGTLIA